MGIPQILQGLGHPKEQGDQSVSDGANFCLEIYLSFNGKPWETYGNRNSRTWFPAKHVPLPSGELTFCHGKSPFLMGKSTISMAIFHCYVSSPEGNQSVDPFHPWISL